MDYRWCLGDTSAPVDALRRALWAVVKTPCPRRPQTGARKGDGGLNMPTLIPDMAIFQRKLATLPLVTYRAGETVLSAASTTGRLLILKEGAVVVVKEGVEIARVTEPGAVFGELSVLLDQPHTGARQGEYQLKGGYHVPFRHNFNRRHYRHGTC